MLIAAIAVFGVVMFGVGFISGIYAVPWAFNITDE
jgi:hypothetical protein